LWKERRLVPRKRKQNGLFGFREDQKTQRSIGFLPAFPLMILFELRPSRTLELLHLGKEKLTIWEAKVYRFTEAKGEAGEVLDIIDNKLARGFLIGSKDNDVPLLITKVGTEKIDMMEA